MQAQAEQTPWQTLLDELEALHREENLALRRLSRETLDELTERKLELWARLQALSSDTPPPPEQRASLERIRRAALHNQILLQHARDSVLTILHTASGHLPTAPSNRPGSMPGGLRVDFKG